MNLKEILRITKPLLVFIILLVANYFLFPDRSISSILIVLFLLFIFFWALSYLLEKINNEVKIKIIRTQFIFSVILLIWTIVFKSIGSIKLFFYNLLLIWFVGKYITKQKKDSYIDLRERVKNDLRIDYVKEHKRNLPKWIGGFVTPIFPLFTVINKKWKKKLTEEAVIHENMHINLLIYKGWLFYLMMTPMIVAILGTLVINDQRLIDFLIYISLVILIVLFEKVTFDKTHEYGKKLGIVTRRWNSRIAIKYFIIYSLWFMMIRLVIFVGKQTINIIKMIF